MPRKNARQTAITPDPAAQEQAEKKWAEPYRPLVTDTKTGFELGENKLLNVMVFTFAGDPGDTVKAQLKHYGYFYDGKQKSWTANATPMTREIARKLAAEFAGEAGLERQSDAPTR